jgi:hypothetical protein
MWILSYLTDTFGKNHDYFRLFWKDFIVALLQALVAELPVFPHVPALKIAIDSGAD